MSQVIAVAGGSGQLGRAIVEAIKADGKFEVIVLGRKSAEASEGKARIVGVEYTDVPSLVQALEDNQVHTVISTINSIGDVSAELNLIEASDKAQATKRYIPATWGVEYTEEVASYFPIAHGKRAVLAALRTTSLEHTNVVNGYFADFFVPQIPTYLSPLAAFLDPSHDIAVIPASGDVPVTFTHTFDIAKYVSALLSADKWDQTTYIIGSKVTWNELVGLFEDAKRTKFEIKHDSLGDLRTGKITELPSHPALYPCFPKEAMQGMLAAFGIMFETGVMDLKPERTANNQFPEVKARSMQELVAAAYRK